jgi:hypothetical protein
MSERALTLSEQLRIDRTIAAPAPTPAAHAAAPEPGLHSVVDPGLFIPYDPVCPYLLGVAPLVGSQAEEHRAWCDHCQLVALLTSPPLA